MEAMSLLCDINIALSEKQVHDLKWNCTCNPHRRVGANQPLDLHMEHMYCGFKDNISTFAPHINPTSVQKTANAAPMVEECMANFDHHMNIKQDSGYHVVPSHINDRHTIFQQLMET